MGLKRVIGLVGFYLFSERLKDRFVAGSSLEDAINRAKFFSKRKEKSVINILGEHAKDREEAVVFREQYVDLIIALVAQGQRDTNIAVKPSQLGLEISEDLYKDNLSRILEVARIYLPEVMVEIDRETHEYARSVRRVSLDLAKRFSNQRLACQINLFETREEICDLINAGISMRICKGNAYPGDIKKEKDLRKIFLEMTFPVVVWGKKKSVFATHDLFLIDSIARRFPLDKDKFEFELLMGIEENLYREPHLQGFTFRRYIPCGPNWRPYGKRRAEAVVNIVLRNSWYKTLRFFEEGLQYVGSP